MDETLKQLYLAINATRKKNGCSILKVNLNLQTAATRHCDDMFYHGFTGHTGSDGSDYKRRAYESGFNGIPSGEIIVKGPGGENMIEAVINGWLGSPPHRKILLDDRNIRMGAAYHLKTEKISGNYWVAVFSH